MPGFNGRGPKGEGLKTGRGCGKCKVGIGAESHEDIIPKGNGHGRGRRNERAWGKGTMNYYFDFFYPIKNKRLAKKIM